MGRRSVSCGDVHRPASWLPCPAGDAEGHGVLGPGVPDVDEQSAVGSLRGDPSEAVCLIQGGESGFAVLAETDEAFPGLGAWRNDSEVLGPVEPPALRPWIQRSIFLSFVHRNSSDVGTVSAVHLEDVIKAAIPSISVFNLLNGDRCV
jgi:hypothetical protein